MKATVDALVQVALYSAAITAGILLFRFIFKNRISSKLQYLMWWLLILRLLMPVTPDIGLHFNLQDMLLKQAHQAELPTPAPVLDVAPASAPIAQSSYESVAPAVQPDTDVAPSQHVNPAKSTDWYSIVFVVWLLGAIGFLGWLIFVKLRYYESLQHLMASGPREVYELYDRCCKELGVKPLPLWIVDKSMSPGIAFFGEPVLLVPLSLCGDESRLRFALLHELTHKKRGDHYMTLLLNILRAVYWFDPVVHFAFSELRSDMESACDSDVLAYIGHEQKRGYLTVILDMFSYDTEPILGMSQIRSKRMAKQRMKGAFMKNRTSPAFRAITLCIALIMSLCCFTTACQSLGTFTVAGSIISTCMGASILFSNYQLIHAGGIRAAITSAFWYGAWLILVLLVGRVRKTGASSIPDYISKRFSPRAQKISAWAIVLVGLSTCAAQFKSIGAMAEALNICNPTTGIILGATVIVLFTFFSGMWGSAVTNTIQSLFILAVVVLVIPLTASRAAGGLSTAMANIDPEKLSFSNSSMSMSLFFSYLVSSSLNVACEPSYSKYSLAAKDAKSAVRGQLIAWAVCTCVWLISVIPPLWINQIFPDMTDGSLFVTRLVATYMPVGLRGMVIAVVLSLLITTGNSFLLLLTSSITDDVIRPMKPSLSDKSLLRISRIVIAGGATLIALIAIVVPDIATAFKIGANAFGPVVAIPVLLSFFWKGVNDKATSIAMVLSVIVSVCLDIYFVYVVGVGAIGNMYAAALSLVINVFGSIYFNAKQKKAAA